MHDWIRLNVGVFAETTARLPYSEGSLTSTHKHLTCHKHQDCYVFPLEVSRIIPSQLEIMSLEPDLHRSTKMQHNSQYIHSLMA